MVRRRSAVRWAVRVIAGGAALLLPGCDPAGPTYTVDSVLDAPDASPGDGTCKSALGECTLRAAVMEANAQAGSATVSLGANQTYELTIGGRGEDAASTGDLDVNDNLRIDGNGATIDAAGIDRVLDVRSGGLRLEAVTITGGHALGSSGGGLRIEAGAMGHVLGSHITGNSSEITVTTGPMGPTGFQGGFACGGPFGIPEVFECWGEGGGAGIWSRGTLLLGDSAVTANTALGGGCVIVYFTPVTQGTICGWAEGGGVFADGGALISSTIAGNTLAAGAGGGLAGSARVVSSTIASNTVTTTSGQTSPRGVQVEGAVELRASVVDGSAPLCGPGAVSAGWNVAADATCGLDQPTDRASHDPELDALGDHGGPTPTMPPRSSSPARDLVPAGTALVCDGVLAVDQRGEPRPDGAACDAGAVEGPGEGPPALAAVVNHGGDAVDASPGDGICQDAGGDPGECSLRAAIDEANAWGAIDTITIAPGIDPRLARAGADEDTNQTGDLDITDPVTIEGGGAVLDASGLDRALHLHGSVVVVRDLTVTGGATAGDGGGIRQDGGTLVLERSTIAANVAARGGGLARTSGSAVLTNVTVSGNVANGTQGGGLHHLGGTLALTYTTVHDNAAASAPALFGEGGSVTVRGSILSGVGGDCVADVTSLGHNLGTDASCDLDEATDQPSTTVQLGALADNGGGSATHLPAGGSPGADAIAPGTGGLCDGSIAVDQRGVARPHGPGCDVGAVEGYAGELALPLELVVDHAGDALDAVPGDGVCQDTGAEPGRCSLRAAVQEANAWPAADTVTIASDVDPVLSRAGAGEDGNLTGDLDVLDGLTIEGAGATVDAAAVDRALDLRGAPLVVSDLTITGGGVTGSGGGVRADGDLAVTGSTIHGNTASVDGGGIAQLSGDLQLVESTMEGNHALRGGALQVGPAAAVDVVRSTLAGNTADWGGAVWVDSGATGRLSSSTVSGNHAVGAGALWVAEPDGSATIESSTVVGNDNADGWAAIEAPTGAVEVTASILDNRDPNCGTAAASGGWNVAGDAACQLDVATDQQGVEPEVAALADNGGPTRTHLPFAGSPVLDTVPAGTPGRCDGTDPTDQRGAARPAGAACDTGAVEGDAGVPLVALAITVNHPGDDVDVRPGDGTCQDAAGAPGACSLRAAVDEANAWPAADTITIGAGVHPVLARAGAGEDGNLTGDLDVIDDLTIDGAGATVHAAGIDRVLDLDGSIVEIRDVTITGGDAGSGDGGGVRAVGTSLKVVDATITTNAARDGGGLWEGAPLSDGALVITGSTISSNEASRDGGGLFRTNSGEGDVTDSRIDDNVAGGRGGGMLLEVRTHLLHITVDGNTAATGGGIAITDGSSLPSPILEDSTVSGNTATVAGGGIAATGQNGRLATIDSTVSGNQAPRGGGFYLDPQFAGLVDITATTVVDNTAAIGAGIEWQQTIVTNIRGSVFANNGPECAGTLRSLGYNVAEDTTCPFNAVGDVEGVAVLLGPLADNGGPTLTHLPAVGSPVLDRVPASTAGLCDAATPADQRGLPRPSGVGCDSGAVERQPTDP